MAKSMKEREFERLGKTLQAYSPSGKTANTTSGTTANTTSAAKNTTVPKSTYDKMLDDALNRTASYAQQGAEQTREVADTVQGGMTQLDTGDKKSFNWETARQAQIDQATAMQVLRSMKLFDTEEYAYNPTSVNLVSADYLKELADALPLKRAGAAVQDDYNRALAAMLEVQSNQYPETALAWQHMYNNLHAMNEGTSPWFWGYADYLLNGGKPSEFDTSAYNDAWDAMTDEELEQEYARLEKQFAGLDWDTLTDKDRYTIDAANAAKYAPEVPYYDAAIDTVNNEIARREEIDALRASIRGDANYDVLSQYVNPGTATTWDEIISGKDYRTYNLENLLNFFLNNPMTREELENALGTTGAEAANYNGAIYQSYFNMGYDYLTTDELADYNALYNAGRFDDAARYLELLRPEMLQRRAGVNEQYYRTKAVSDAWSAIGSGAESIAQGVLNIGALPVQLVETALGIDNPYSAAYDFVNAQGWTRDEQKKWLAAQETAEWLKELELFGYEGFMGAADNTARLLAAGFNPTVSLIFAGGQGMSGALKDMAGKDADATAKLIKAFTSGAYEILTEKIGIDSLFDMGKDSALKYFLSEMASELGEETVNTLAEDLTEVALSLIFDYESEIKSVGDLTDDLLDTIYQTAGSTLFMGGGGALNMTRQNKNLVNQVDGNGSWSTLIDMGKAFGDDTAIHRIAEQLEQQQRGGGKLRINQRGAYIRELTEAVGQQNATEIQQVLDEDIAARMTELGTEKQEAKAAAPTVRKLFLGERLSAKDKKAFQWADNAERVLQELYQPAALDEEGVREYARYDEALEYGLAPVATQDEIRAQVEAEEAANMDEYITEDESRRQAAEEVTEYLGFPNYTDEEVRAFAEQSGNEAFHQTVEERVQELMRDVGAYREIVEQLAQERIAKQKETFDSRVDERMAQLNEETRQGYRGQAEEEVRAEMGEKPTEEEVRRQAAEEVTEYLGFPNYTDEEVRAFAEQSGNEAFHQTVEERVQELMRDVGAYREIVEQLAQERIAKQKETFDSRVDERMAQLNEETRQGYRGQAEEEVRAEMGEKPTEEEVRRQAEEEVAGELGIEHINELEVRRQAEEEVHEEMKEEWDRIVKMAQESRETPPAPQSEAAESTVKADLERMRARREYNKKFRATVDQRVQERMAQMEEYRAKVEERVQARMAEQAQYDEEFAAKVESRITELAGEREANVEKRVQEEMSRRRGGQAFNAKAMEDLSAAKMRMTERTERLENALGHSGRKTANQAAEPDSAPEEAPTEKAVEAAKTAARQKQEAVRDRDLEEKMVAFGDDDGNETKGEFQRVELRDGKLVAIVKQEGGDDTSAVDLGSIEGTGSEGMTTILEYAQDAPHAMSPEQINSMLMAYETQGGDAGTFIEDYEDAYLAGYTGTGQGTPEPGVQAIAFEQGKREAAQDEDSRVQRVKQAKQQTTGEVTWIGKVSEADQVRGKGTANSLQTAMSTLSASQKQAVLLVGEFAKRFKTDVVLYQSDGDDIMELPNGQYSPETNTIYLDVNGGANSAQDIADLTRSGTIGNAMLRYLGHELTHALESGSATGYAAYRQAVRDSLQRRNVSYEALVRNKLQTALNFGQKLTLGGAEAEVIADASEYMLQNTAFIQSAPNSVRSTIVSAIKNFARKVREVFSTLTGGHKESLALRELNRNMLQYVDDLQQKWDIAAEEMVSGAMVGQDAQATAQNAQEAAQSVQYSAREEDQPYTAESVNSERQNAMREDQTQTEEFKRWFGDSVVVNEDGSPKVMYHGTPYGGFTVFKGWQYFTDDKEYAGKYHNPSASSIRGRYNPATNEKTYEVYLSVKKPFDTRIPEVREIWENEFYDHYSRTPLSERGVPDWTDGIDLVEFIEDNEYDFDGIILDEGGVGGYGDEVKDRGLSVVVRNSNQIKDASPVTYDDAGEVIPLSERFDTGKQDIRFSLREVDGQQVVWVDENILASKPESISAHKFIRNYLVDHIDDVYTVIESGSKVHPAKQLPQEYLYSREAQSHNKSNRNLFSAKLKIVPGIGEMVEIASNRRWEKAKHIHNKNAKYGVYRYDTRVAFESNGVAEAYTAELVILNADDGKKYLYDIVNIKKDDITAKRLMVKARSGGETAQQTNAVTDSVLQTAESVNSERKFSRRDEMSTLDVRQMMSAMQITDGMTETEKDMLTRYKSHLTEMQKLEEQIAEQKAIIDSNDATTDEKAAAKARMKIYDRQRARHNGYLRKAESSNGFARLMVTSQNIVRLLSSDSLENAAEKLQSQIIGIQQQLVAVGKSIEQTKQTMGAGTLSAPFNQQEVREEAKRLKNLYSLTMSEQELRNRLSALYSMQYAMASGAGEEQTTAEQFAGEVRALAYDIYHAQQPGQNQRESINNIMAEIGALNWHALEDSELANRLRKIISDSSGNIQQDAAAIADIMQEAGRAANRAGNVATGVAKKANEALQAADYYRKLEEQRRLMQLKEEKEAIAEQLKKNSAGQMEAIWKRLDKQKELTELQKQKRKEDAQARKIKADTEKRVSRIRRKTRTLSERLVTPTDSRHIPPALQDYINRLLQTFTESALHNFAFTDAEASVLLRDYGYLLGEEDEVGADADIGNIMENITFYADQYEKLRSSLKGNAYRDVTYRSLEGVTLENAIVKEVEKIIDNAYAMVSKLNSTFSTNRHMTFKEFADEATGELAAKPDKGMRSMTATALNDAIVQGNLTPVYLFERLDNKALSDIFSESTDAMRKTNRIVRDAQAFFGSAMQRYHAAEWQNDKPLHMTTEDGDRIELTRGLAMSLYATYKREQTNTLTHTHHLLTGGFEYENAHDIGNGHRGTQGTHRMTERDMNVVTGWLTEEQRACADEIVKYLSTTLAEYGNEATMELYGYKKFSERYYFPFKSARVSSPFKVMDNTSGQKHVTKQGFTHSVKRSAGTPVIIGDFFKTTAEHAYEMAYLAGTAASAEKFGHILNYKIKSDNGKEERYKEVFRRKYGENVSRYVEDFIRDLNGRQPNNNRYTKALDSMTGNFRKTAVMYNMSVIVQQPMSVFRAFAHVNPRYFVNAFTAHPMQTWNEMLRYSGAAIAKDVGGYNVGMGRSGGQYIRGNDSVGDVYGRYDNKLKAFARAATHIIDSNPIADLPQTMDILTWSYIWNAVKNEQAARNPGMDRNSEEFLAMCGKRADDVLMRTQVFDSVLTRSGWMRSTSKTAKSLTAFMAEPTLTANMLIDAFTNKKYTAGQRARVLGSVFLSITMTAAAAALAQMFRRDDDERTALERFAGSFVSNLSESIDPFGMLPFAGEIQEALSGKDITRDEFSNIVSTSKAIKKFFGKVWNGEQITWKDAENAIGGIANIFGIPAKNVSREMRSIYNAATADWTKPSAATLKYTVLDNIDMPTITAVESLIDRDLWDDSNAAYYKRIAKAYAKGDMDKAQELQEYLVNSKGVSEKTIKTQSKSALKAIYMVGELERDEAETILMDVYGETEAEAFWTVEEWQYKTDNGADADYRKYDDLFAAVESGENLKSTIKTYTDNGVTKQTLSSQVTGKYMQQLADLWAEGKKGEYANLLARVLTAYEAMGYSRSDKKKEIERKRDEIIKKSKTN